MKRSTKIWYKQCIAWVLIVLMSINTFAAVVGDNDGAAFITNKTTMKMIQHKKALKI
ncbi:MAG: hypothetical protein IJ593_12165 [Lachnospiraceae bacterium]|nr:hypothetical protein [Lachnospiraceae bacterium]